MRERGKPCSFFFLLSTSYKPRPVKVARLFRWEMELVPGAIPLGNMQHWCIGSTSAFQAVGKGSTPLCCSRAIEPGLASGDNRKDGVRKLSLQSLTYAGVSTHCGRDLEAMKANRGRKGSRRTAECAESRI